MIKLIVKLAIVALIANATWRVGSAYANFYKFQDSVHQATQFRGRKSDEELRQRLMALANEYDVPIKAEDFVMKTEFNHFIVDTAYVRKIDVVPGYTYSWPFAVHADVFIDK